MKIQQVVKIILKNVILFLIIVFLVSYVIENWNKIGEFEYEISWVFLALSFLFLLGSLFFLPLALQNIVKVLGYEISIRKMCLILFYSQIAKYLPGGIWGYVGRVYLYKKEGMNAHDASTCVFLETLLVLLSGIFIFFLSFWFLDKTPSIKWIPIKYIHEIGIFGLIILLFLIHPKILNFLWGLIPTRFRKDSLKFDYSYFSLFKPGLFLVFFWLGVGGGFWLLIRSFFCINPYLLPITTGAYVLAWVVGFLAFFTPGGLGAREAVLVLSLNLYLPISISAVTAASARIWWVIGELIWASLSFIWNKFERDGKET
ncbi:MAG: flippase-like domain-containing protein [Deltaproteobacteria bacterium]|nr:flippase-like domain-containing protein [Deltaproteobacteria bacterium]